MTVKLASFPKDIPGEAPAHAASIMYATDGEQNNDDADGTNYYAVPLVAPPKMDLYRSLFPNDAVLAQCKLRADLGKDVPIDGQGAIKTGAFFVTVTQTRTETNCHPGLACAVRRESSETGGLAVPPANTVPPPPELTSTPLGMAEPPQPHAPWTPQGPAAPKASMGPAKGAGSASPHRSGIKGDTLRAENTQAPQAQAGAEAPALANGAAGAAGAAGAMGALTVKTEHSASALDVPVPTKKAPLPGIEEVPALPMSSAVPAVASAAASIPLPAEPTPTAARPPSTIVSPTAIVPAPIPSLVVGSSTVSIEPILTQVFETAHVEQSVGFKIGSKTASIGQTLTIDNHPVVVTTSAGSTYAIVQNAPGENSAASTIALNLPNPALVGGGGGIFAPKPAVVGSVAAPVTAFNAVLTPNRGGGYSVSGSSLKINGPPVTLGAGPSPTVLSLTTDTAGQDVLVANGESSTLSSASSASETGWGAKTAVYNDAAPSLRSWSHRHSYIWICGWTILLAVMAR
jgi:hypothetical protein